MHNDYKGAIVIMAVLIAFMAYNWVKTDKMMKSTDTIEQQ